MKKTTLSFDVTYDERWTTPEAIADALASIMAVTLSTEDVLGDVHNPHVGGVYVPPPAETLSYLTKPLTIDEIREQIKNSEPKDNFIHGVVAVDIDDVYGKDEDIFLDMLSLLLTDTDILEDIDYSVVGHAAGLVLVRVSGDATSILETAE